MLAGVGETPVGPQRASGKDEKWPSVKMKQRVEL